MLTDTRILVAMESAMFSAESEMTETVASWMKSAGLIVRSEFVTPWGICDLAGVSFNPDRVRKREEHCQFRSLRSVTEAAVFLRVPDFESEESVTKEQLAEELDPFVSSDELDRILTGMIENKFLVKSKRQRLQRVNGWIPLQDQIVAVELKLEKVSEAFQQASRNLGFADESYVCFPTMTAKRVLSSNRWAQYLSEGIGVLAVSPNRCHQLMPAKRKNSVVPSPIKLYCVEKFWKNKSKAAHH